ncbi:hypothetical protein ACFXAY_35050 [Streptomyces microflavus]
MRAAVLGQQNHSTEPNGPALTKPENAARRRSPWSRLHRSADPTDT